MHRIVSAVATTALAAGIAVLVPGTAFAAGTAQQVAVHGGDAGLSLDRTSVPAGKVTFSVDTTSGVGSQVSMFTLANGATLRKVFADFKEEFSGGPKIAAQGTRDLNNDATFYGLADVSPRTPAKVTEVLLPGTYYLVDLGAMGSPSSLTATLQVTPPVPGSASSLAALGQAQVMMTAADRFETSSSVLPATGTVQVTNNGDTIHFMDFSPVAPGTTDGDIQAFFLGAGPNPFINGPSVGLDVIDPGRTALLSYSLPAGTYVMVCFVADAENGIPHALMGMHLVVTLG